jgi:D-alanine-D-alanine ligase
MSKIRVGVVFGGRSGEHEVSIRSAAAVVREMDKERYEVIPIHIDKAGRWLGPADSAEVLPPPARLALSPMDDYPAGETGLSGSAGVGGLTTGGRTIPVDVFFPVLHGTYGEDGTIQGLFEMADIPYVGCGVVASSCGMDKVMMKTMFADAGLPICRHEWFLRSAWEGDGDRVIRRVEAEIGYPCFVKPANLGSSVGVSRADDEKALRAAIALAAEFDGKIIVEECLDMREIECGVLGNESPEASLPGEYVVKDDSKRFLDYTEKYAGTGNNEFVVPSPIPMELADRVRSMAVDAFAAIAGSGLARVDFFLRNDTGELLVNEINTMPGLTDSSGFPKMWEASGLDLRSLVDRLITLAIDRHRDRARNRTCL